MHKLGFGFMEGVKYRLFIPAFTVSEHSPGPAANFLDLLLKKKSCQESHHHKMKKYAYCAHLDTKSQLRQDSGNASHGNSLLSVHKFEQLSPS